MSGILIYADKASLAREMRTAANGVANGSPIKQVALTCDEGAAESGSAETYTVNVEAPDAALIASVLSEAAHNLECDVILVAGDRRGKDVSGRLAQKLGAGVITGISSLDMENGEIVASYPSLGGAVVNRSVISSDYKVFVVSPNSYAECEATAVDVHALSVEVPTSRVNVGEARKKEGSSVDVAAADILVVVGCGVEDQDAIDNVESFAQKLGGVVGCTKPVATDRKWFSEDRIIGISGKTCKPRLAILLGISGQVQFWAGIRNADTVISFNTDEHAAIASMADCSYVCDAIEGVKEFESLMQ